MDREDCDAPDDPEMHRETLSDVLTGCQQTQDSMVARYCAMLGRAVSSFTAQKLPRHGMLEHHLLILKGEIARNPYAYWVLASGCVIFSRMRVPSKMPDFTTNSR